MQDESTTVNIKVKPKYVYRMPTKKIIVAKSLILDRKRQQISTTLHDNVKHEFIGNDLVSLGGDIRISQTILDDIFSNKPGIYVIKLAEIVFGKVEMETAALKCDPGKSINGLNPKKLEALIRKLTFFNITLAFLNALFVFQIM
jgi:hypothetical protein